MKPYSPPTVKKMIPLPFQTNPNPVNPDTTDMEITKNVKVKY